MVRRLEPRLHGARRSTPAHTSSPHGDRHGGNASLTSLDFTVTIDTAAPTVSIGAPSASVTRSGSHHLRGHVFRRRPIGLAGRRCHPRQDGTANRQRRGERLRHVGRAPSRSRASPATARSASASPPARLPTRPATPRRPPAGRAPRLAVDNSSPRIASIARRSPDSSPTTPTRSRGESRSPEPMRNVDPTDFACTGTTGDRYDRGRLSPAPSEPASTWRCPAATSRNSSPPSRSASPPGTIWPIPRARADQSHADRHAQRADLRPHQHHRADVTVDAGPLAYTENDAATAIAPEPSPPMPRPTGNAGCSP